MTFKNIAAAIGLSTVVGLVPSAQAITLDFANVTGAVVEFNGSSDTFRFLPGTPADQLQITASTGNGSAVGKKGRIDGSFNIGAITTAGLTQTAPVTGSGTMIIHDGAGKDLTGSVVWDSIATVGTGGVINVNGLLNLSSIVYAGTVADLVTLAAAGAGTEVVTFQFIPGKTLTELTQNGAINSTSFSGNINTQVTGVPDSGSALSLLGLGLLALGAFSYRKGLLSA